MRIIVPMAGIGSRLRPHTLTTPKPLTVVAGKPIVQHLVEDIAKVVGQEIEEIAFIIGPIEKGFKPNTEAELLKIASDLGTKGRVYTQHEALGTAHAIYCAKESLNGPCVVAFADTLFRANFTIDANADGAIWVKQVDDPSAFGVVKLQDGIITDFVEKPKDFVSDLAIIGIYYFKDGDAVREEVEYLVDNKILVNGEYQLTDVLETLKQKGTKFVPGEVSEWMDCGNKNATVDTNSRLLGLLTKEDGLNLVSEDVVIENSKIIEPCYIGKNVKLVNSTVGPNVSLGEGSVVEGSVLEDCLIQTNVSITSAKLKNSMIGHHAKYNGEFTSISIGDYTDLS